MRPRPPGPARSSVRRGAALAAVLALVGSTVLISTPLASAAAVTVTPLGADNFADATTASPNWRVVGEGSSTRACLTAGTDATQLPIGGCASPAIDAPGSGTLRLTTNATGQVGTVYNSTSIPTTEGIDVVFNTYQYSGSGADGIAFVLAATDPTNPSPPVVTGPAGGSLGYSATGGGQQGVSFGYMGFGLDVFGNFRNSAFGGVDCASSSFSAQNVTVRGPGNGNRGYCILGTATSSGRLDRLAAGPRPAAVPVQVALNPDPVPATTASGLTVPARSWLVSWTSLGAPRQLLTGPLPTATTLAGLGFPASYYDPATGLPYQLTFGWSASTGGSTEIHEINRLSATTLTGQLPSYRLAVDDDQGGRLLTGGRATIAVTPSLDPAQGVEREPATVTTTLPVGLTPTNPTTPGYVCTTTGQVVSCRYTPATPIPAGAALPTLQIPVTVGAAAGSSPVITAKVSSTDANPQTATRTVSVVAFTASATPASVSYGTATTLSGIGLPSDATGTIVFRSGTTELCTVALPATGCTPSSTLLPGTYPVTATYAGDARYPAASATTTFTVGRAATVVTGAASSASVPYGTAQTLTASIAPSGATGAVSFRAADGTVLCTIADITAGAGCAAPAALEPGTYRVTTEYAGDTRFAGATAAPFAFDVVRAATDITAAVAADPVVFGTAALVSFAGLPAGATGSVVFTAGETTLCTVADVTSDQDCVAPADLPAGSYPVLATYSGDSRHLGSTAETSFTVSPYPTVLAAGVSDAAVPFGTATTVSYSGVPAGATGTVVFTAGDVALCTVDVTAGTGCATPVTLTAGAYDVTAVYSGDADHESSTATTSFDVTPAGVPSFAAGVSDAEPVYGSPVTLSFSGLPNGSTGAVVFRSGTSVLCEIVDVTAAASCATTADLPAGPYPVQASYSGDRNHAPATATTAFTVLRAATQVVAAVSAAQTTYGTPVGVWFTGLPSGATGTVTYAGAGAGCTVDVTSERTGCLGDAGLAVGTYPVSVTYSGDADHLGSSAEAVVTVVPAPSPDFAAAVTPAEIPFGSPTVLSFVGLVPGATGTVVFRAGDRTLCTVEDVVTSTGCTATGGLPVGDHAVEAVYGGDPNHAPAVAGTAFRVVRATVVPVVSPGRPAVTFGDTTTLSVTGLPSGATGSVTFTAGDRVLCTVADVTAAAACLTPADLPAGVYPVVAAYSGDGSYTAATSAAVTLGVDKATSAVTVVVADTSPVYGAGTTLALTGLPVDATGSATFTSGDRVLCTIADVSTQPDCAVPADLDAGSYPVTGVWSGDADHLGSSAAGLFVVEQAPTDISLTVADLTFGEEAAPRIGGIPAGATGTVTLTGPTGVLCEFDAADGEGCLAVAGLRAGDYTVVAEYSGDGNHAGSRATASFTVAPRATSFTVAVADVAYGTVPVPVVSGLPEGATGTITVTAGGQVVCTVDVVTGQGCTEVLASLQPGAYAYVATYSGDRDNLPASADVAFTVSPAPTAVALTVPDAAYGGAIVPTVSGLPADATGTVTITDGDGVVCVIDLGDGSGCAGLVAGAVGPVTLTARYSGDARYLPSATTTTFQVTRATVAVVGGATGPVVSGGTTTLTVGPDVPADATGTVTFVVDGVVLCTVALPERTCQASTALPPGDYDVQVLYAGDGNYAPSETVTRLTVTTDVPDPVTPVTPVVPAGGGSNPLIPHQPLAYTGTSLSGGIAGGALLLVVGGLLLLGSRRRPGTRGH